MQPASPRARADARTVAEIACVGLAMPSSAYQATLRPFNLAVRRGSGTGTTPESTPSGPTSPGTSNGRSDTHRAIGPTWLRRSVGPPGGAYEPAPIPWLVLGFMAAMPQQ